MKTIVISGRRWFQRTYGNTYHSVTVYMPDGAELRCGFAYGYGEQFRETGLDLIEKHLGAACPRSQWGGRKDVKGWLASHGYELHTDCADVSRKRDL